VYPHSYNEDGTLSVIVSGEYNLIIFERKVFGISPNDLTECDLPSEDDVLGTILTDKQAINEHLRWFHKRKGDKDYA